MKIMENQCCLSSLKIGQKAIVTGINISGNDRRRLLDIGFTDGCTVECLHISPSGDPTAYSIRGAVIALRQEDSSQILIEKS